MAVGVAVIALGVAIWIDPALASGLHATTSMDVGGM